MTDEKFLYKQDIREKKITARSARNKRTHTGKGGSVRLPSDNLSRKELNAMNGEVKSYRLNEPMSWKEFNEMPDDIKATYIKALQTKFNAPATALGKMFGVSRSAVDLLMKRLKIEHRGRGCNKWDREGFLLWVNGVPKAEETQITKDDFAEMEKAINEQAKLICDHTEKSIPCAGCLSFEGSADNALKTIGVLLGGANARITISWELCDNG